MADTSIGVGIIGANVNYGWGTRAHIPALQALAEFRLVAVGTTRTETAEQTARAFKIPNAYAEVEPLVTHADVDLVLICVRVPHHHELTRLALQAGKHVFCEWPLGANLQQAVELRDLAEAQGVHHMVGLQARAAPAFVRMRELVAEGFVGQVLTATMHSSLPGAGGRPEAFAWAADADQGATTLTIAAGHSLDALTFVLGEFRSVSAQVTTQVRTAEVIDTGRTIPVTAPDTVLVTGELEGGAVVAADIKSVPLHGAGLRFDVHGTDGTLRVTSTGMAQIGDLELRGARRDDEAVAPLPVPEHCRWVPENLSGPPLNVAQLFRRLGESIREGGAADPDFTHAVRSHELLAAVQHASDTGQRQAL